ncbi:hypothetical protein [Maledivibacter halophilus]|uniref:Uncharacterized protein n=1 Tax=Maledivibacter halophilus TaxID=36842 RepID=A0A1T5MFT8_9FIRM|nr:hypothetical protein [Maledivibacter halophilus]SKC86943.1 hypothetical protein SAMN02194393_04602 [Maledivibacter halophilus]
MDISIFYIAQAVSGTSQEGKENIDIKKLQKWLEEFAKIIMEKTHKLWLKNMGIESLEEIEAAVIEYLEIYQKEKGPSQMAV